MRKTCNPFARRVEDAAPYHCDVARRAVSNKGKKNFQP